METGTHGREGMEAGVSLSVDAGTYGGFSRASNQEAAMGPERGWAVTSGLPLWPVSTASSACAITS